MKNNKSGKILNVLLGVIAIFIIIFVIAWIVNRGNKNNNAEMFNDNLNSMQETAKEYFANDLPEEVGDSIVMTLKEMYELGLIDKLTYGNTTCDKDDSYISITKINETEYKVKSNLVCGDKEDNITEKVEGEYKVKDEDGNVIIDTEKDTKEDTTVIESKKDNKKDESNKTITSNDCKNGEISAACEVTTNTDYCIVNVEYQHVKRTVSCPYGYTMANGSCIKTDTVSVNATPRYSENYTAHEPAKENTGSSYKVYTDPIVTPGTTSYYCNEGTLSGNKCIIYTSKATTSGCPTGYTASGNYCYKYADKVTTSTLTCPSGYTKSGSGSSMTCYKTTTATSTSSKSCPSGYTQSGSGSSMKCYKTTAATTSTSCPTGYSKSGSRCVKTSTANKTYTAWGNPTSTYQTFTKESTYTNELEKKVLVGTGTKAGKTIYTYSIYKRSYTYTCATGTLSGTTCYSYVDLNSVTTCPSGYVKSGSTCYLYTDPVTSSSTSCPSGYTKSGSTCYLYTNPVTTTTTSCPSGYTKSGSTCYLYANPVTTTTSSCPSSEYTEGSNNCYIKISKTTESYCPSGYTDNGSNCKKTINAQSTTTQDTYSCPSGYTKSGSGKGTTCYQTRQNDSTYYCERANATLVGKVCYYTVEGGIEGYDCPAGYNQNGSTCTKVNTESVAPVWSNSELLFSKYKYLDGYQRTGTVKYITTCYAKTSEIIYK